MYTLLPKEQGKEKNNIVNCDIINWLKNYSHKNNMNDREFSEMVERWKAVSETEGSASPGTPPGGPHTKWLIGGFIAVFVISISVLAQYYSGSVKTQSILPTPKPAADIKIDDPKPAPIVRPNLTISVINNHCEGTCSVSPSPAIPTATPIIIVPPASFVEPVAPPVVPIVPAESPSVTPETSPSPISQAPQTTTSHKISFWGEFLKLFQHKQFLTDYLVKKADAAISLPSMCTNIVSEPKGKVVLKELNYPVNYVPVVVGGTNTNEVLSNFCNYSINDISTDSSKANSFNNPFYDIIGHLKPLPQYIIRTKTSYDCNTKTYTCSLDNDADTRLCNSSATTKAGAVYVTGAERNQCVFNPKIIIVDPLEPYKIWYEEFTSAQLNAIQRQYGTEIMKAAQVAQNWKMSKLLARLQVSKNWLTGMEKCFNNPSVSLSSVVGVSDCTNDFKEATRDNLMSNLMDCFSQNDVEYRKNVEQFYRDNDIAANSSLEPAFCKLCGVLGPTKACPHPPVVVNSVCPAPITAAITGKNTAQTVYDSALKEKNNATQEKSAATIAGQAVNKQYSAASNDFNVATANLRLAQSKLDYAIRTRATTAVITAARTTVSAAQAKLDIANASLSASKKLYIASNKRISDATDRVRKAETMYVAASGKLSAANKALANLRKSFSATVKPPLPVCFTTP